MFDSRPPNYDEVVAELDPSCEKFEITPGKHLASTTRSEELPPEYASLYIENEKEDIQPIQVTGDKDSIPKDSTNDVHDESKRPSES